MKIAKIDVYQVDLPYAGGVYHLSGGREYRSFDATIVCITTACGLQGWGESTPFGASYIAAHARGARAGIAEMAPGLIGHDPRLVDRMNERMDTLLLGHLHAKTALDVACWDILGKSTGLPVHALLGGSTGQRMPAISSIGTGTPDDMRTRVAQHRALGYRGHSIKIGATDADGGPMLDAARIQACLADRQAGEFFLCDANGGMLPEQVLRLLRVLPDGLDFVLEAPCATWRETASVRARCNVPIILDELAQDDCDVAQAVAQDICDGIGLKISKNGGLTRGRRQRDICLAAGLTISVQETTGSDIAFAAIAHLGQTVPAQSLRCILDTRDMVSVSTAEFDAPIVDGGIRAPDGPGLGVTPKMDVLGNPVATYA